MLTGSIASLGSHYLIGIRAVNCQTGDSLGAEQAEADNREKVLGTLGNISTALRGKLGESMTSVQKFGKPLEQATTSSLDALKAFSEGHRIQTHSDTDAIPFFQRAIELDQNFALAYAYLGVCYSNLNETSPAFDNLRKAYNLRERVSERERFFITTNYYSIVTGELEKANQEYQLWINSYPHDEDPHNNLGVNYFLLGLYEKGAAEQLECTRLAPEDSICYGDLAGAYLTLDRLDEAKTILDSRFRQDSESLYLRFNAYLLAFLRDDAKGMEQAVEWSRGKHDAEPRMLQWQSDTEAYHGRLTIARSLMKQAVDSAKHNDAPEVAALSQLDLASTEADFGNPSRAKELAYSALTVARGRDVRLNAALVLARVGDASKAKIWVDELSHAFPLDTIVQRYWLPSIRAQIELSRGDKAKALALLDDVRPYDLAQAASLYPAYVRGAVLLQDRRGREAAAEFQKILSHRGFIFNSYVGPLSRLGLARAYVLQGDTGKARTEYQDFLAIWKDADADIPILKQAKAEYAKLR
jgi:predicted Zn-dependent protease